MLSGICAMKIKISYTDAEKILAQSVAMLIERTIKGISRKNNNKNGEYKHIYLQTPKKS